MGAAIRVVATLFRKSDSVIVTTKSTRSETQAGKPWVHVQDLRGDEFGTAGRLEGIGQGDQAGQQHDHLPFDAVVNLAPRNKADGDEADHGGGERDDKRARPRTAAAMAARKMPMDSPALERWTTAVSRPSSGRTPSQEAAAALRSGVPRSSSTSPGLDGQEAHAVAEPLAAERDTPRSVTE